MTEDRQVVGEWQVMGRRKQKARKEVKRKAVRIIGD